MIVLLYLLLLSSIVLVWLAFVADKPICAVAALLCMIVVICIDEGVEQKRTIENATSIQIDTIYLVSNTDTIVTYNVTYIK